MDIEKQKNNKKIIILITVASVILLAVGILIPTGIISFNSNKEKDNYINGNSNNNNGHSNNNGNSISKLDNSKEWVYDANYKLPTNKESYYGYVDHTKLISVSDLVVPYININSNDAARVNQEIYKLYVDLIDEFNKNLKEEVFFTLVNYKTYINDNIISIIITTESAGADISDYDYYTYNFKNWKIIVI